jgi:hypothetical protein
LIGLGSTVSDAGNTVDRAESDAGGFAAPAIGTNKT